MSSNRYGSILTMYSILFRYSLKYGMSLEEKKWQYQVTIWNFAVVGKTETQAGSNSQDIKLSCKKCWKPMGC